MEVIRKYYDTGELLSEEFIITGKKEGAHKTYYKNGNLHQITNYINDHKNGYSYEYYEKGLVYKIYGYDNDILKEEHFFHQNGNIWINRSYDIDRKLTGNYEIYYENGQIKEFGSYINGKKV